MEKGSHGRQRPQEGQGDGAAPVISPARVMQQFLLIPSWVWSFLWRVASRQAWRREEYRSRALSNRKGLALNFWTEAWGGIQGSEV